MRNTLKKARGLTLIELVAVITIIGVLAAAAAPMMVSALGAYDATHNTAVTLDKLRYATERMARELREVRSTSGSFDFASMSGTSPVFTRTDGAATRVVTIAQAGGAVTLSYDAPSVTPAPVLTDGLSNLSFKYFDKYAIETIDTGEVRYVEIALSLAQGTQTYAQRTRVRLRNP